MLEIKTPKNAKAKRELDRRAPKLFENGKKTLILAAKTSNLLNTILTEIFHLKRGSAIKYSRKNDNIRPFENGGETSLEFFSQKIDCSLFVVIENLNLAGVDRVFVCTVVSSKKVFLTHCALRLKRSGTVVPRMELVEVGPSMDLVMRGHRLLNDGLRKEAIKTSLEKPKKKVKNVSSDIIQGKVGKIYIPDQQVGGMELSYNAKGLKRERCEAKMNKETTSSQRSRRWIKSDCRSNRFVIR